MLYKRLKVLRKELGLTQTEFGEILGKKLRTVQDWEGQKNTPPESVLELICIKFNVSMNWLRDGSGNMFLTHPLNSQNMYGSGIQIQNGNIKIYGTTSNPMTESVAGEVKELFELILEYGTPKIIRNFKSKMLEIKRLHEE